MRAWIGVSLSEYEKHGGYLRYRALALACQGLRLVSLSPKTERSWHEEPQAFFALTRRCKLQCICFLALLLLQWPKQQILSCIYLGVCLSVQGRCALFLRSARMWLLVVSVNLWHSFCRKFSVLCIPVFSSIRYHFGVGAHFSVWLNLNLLHLNLSNWGHFLRFWFNP